MKIVKKEVRAVHFLTDSCFSGALWRVEPGAGLLVSTLLGFRRLCCSVCHRTPPGHIFNTCAYKRILGFMDNETITAAGWRS